MNEKDEQDVRRELKAAGIKPEAIDKEIERLKKEEKGKLESEGFE